MSIQSLHSSGTVVKILLFPKWEPMRIIAKKRLDEYGKKYGHKASVQLQAWYQEAKEANWRSPQDILDRYHSADIVNGETAIFNICHNQYRLIVNIWFAGREVYIKFFGTHAEYNRIDVKEL
jgi:mRNA interferase HigB